MSAPVTFDGYLEATRLHALEGLERGVPYAEIVNALLMVALKLSVECEGVKATLEGIDRAKAFVTEHG